MSNLNDKYNFVEINSKPGRYMIIDKTGKVVDDAQGHGFTSLKKAYACISYRDKNVKYKDYKGKFKSLFNKYEKMESIIDDLNELVLYSYKDGEPISKIHFKNKLMKTIKKDIPELFEELEMDPEFKRFFIKKLV